MFSHVFIGIGDFDRAFRFYSAFTEPLGLRLKFCDAEKPWAASGKWRHVRGAAGAAAAIPSGLLRRLLARSGREQNLRVLPCACGDYLVLFGQKIGHNPTSVRSLTDVDF
jgi:hypothetical protein